MVHEKTNEKLPPLKKQKITEKPQEKLDEIKRHVQMENKSWNEWKLQIHWNKLQ